MSDIKNKSAEPLILITGMNGQVGWELQRSMAPLGKIVAIDQQDLDLTDIDKVRLFIRDIKPTVIINAAAYTAVDKAESESDLAFKINAIAPGVIAEEASALGALLIHYSTDYVFNGEKESAYLETDQVDPLNVYGASKLAGEEAIIASSCHYLIFRTSWVFASRGQNFLLSMLRLAREREELTIVADQFGSPTSARLISDVTSHIVKQARNEIDDGVFESDLYNMVSNGRTSWHGFAEKIIDSAKSISSDDFKVKAVKPIQTTDYPTPAKRPLSSCLETSKLKQRFGIRLSNWNEQVDLCVKEI